jgi:hypothetical protein
MAGGIALEIGDLTRTRPKAPSSVRFTAAEISPTEYSGILVTVVGESRVSGIATGYARAAAS